MTDAAIGHLALFGIGIVLTTIGATLIWGWPGAVLGVGISILLNNASEPVE